MVKHIFAPCIPTRGTKVPAASGLFHEIKHCWMRQTSLALDGEAVLLGVDGFSNFEGLLQLDRLLYQRRRFLPLDVCFRG